MKWIDKKTTNEPNTLREYKSTPNASYAGFVDTSKLLKKALCEEQGFVCCYCMRRINESAMSVEHYIPQNRHATSSFTEVEHKAKELLYSNMLASCNSKERGCSEIRGNILLFINPLDALIETQIGYNKKGIAYAINNDGRVKADIETLDLNEEAKKPKSNAYLIENRAAVIDRARERLQGSFTKSNIQKEIQYWSNRNKNGEFKPFCQVAIFYLMGKLKTAQQ